MVKGMSKTAATPTKAFSKGDRITTDQNETGTVIGVDATGKARVALDDKTTWSYPSRRLSHSK